MREWNHYGLACNTNLQCIGRHQWLTKGRPLNREYNRMEHCGTPMRTNKITIVLLLGQGRNMFRQIQGTDTGSFFMDTSDGCICNRITQIRLLLLLY